MDLKKTAILVVDIQKNVMGLDLVPHSSETVLKQTNRLLEMLADKVGLVVLVNAGALAEDASDWVTVASDTELGVTYDPEGMQILAQVPETTPVTYITKKNWGAFYGTSLDAELRRKGIDTLILTGVLTSMGVDTTAREAFAHAYHQIIIEDGISDVDGHLHQEVVQKIFPKFAKVRTLEQFFKELDETHR